MRAKSKAVSDSVRAARLTRAIAAAAHMAVFLAVRAGRLPRLDGSVPCVDCRQPATEYDHREYAKPLDVEPVCRPCNLRRGPASDIAHLCYRRRPPRRFERARKERRRSR